MNWSKIYKQLIDKRISNPPKLGYTEKHHILPRSLKGSDDPSNLVSLTGREHWIAHLLLNKIHKKSETAYACHMMAMKCEERGIPEIRNSRMYETIRIECQKYNSRIMKLKQKGERNSQFGTMWICNLDLKENRKIKKDEAIPEGWIKGRNKWNAKKRKSPEEVAEIRRLQGLRIRGKNNPMFGRKHSKESRKKMSQKKLGDLNPMRRKV